MFTKFTSLVLTWVPKCAYSKSQCSSILTLFIIIPIHQDFLNFPEVGGKNGLLNPPVLDGHHPLPPLLTHDIGWFKWN